MSTGRTEEQRRDLRRRGRRWRRLLLPVVVPLGVLGVLLLAGAAVVGVRLVAVLHDLDVGRTALLAAQADLERADRGAAERHLRRAQTALGSAHSAVDGRVWSTAARVPVLGSSLRELTALSAAGDGAVRTVVPTLLGIDPGPARWTGRVDPAPFVAAQAPLGRAGTSLERVRRDLRGAPRSGVRWLARGRLQLDDALTRLAASVEEAKAVSRAVPPLVRGRHRFLLAIQNSAEQRATGGLIGAYALLGVRDGVLSLDQVGPNQDLVDPATPALSLGAEYDQRYGRFATTRTWRSANLSADTPTVGRLLAALWHQQTGTPVDGVVLIDPPGLARLLSATGGVSLPDHSRLTAKNAVHRLLVDAYAQYARSEDAARNTAMQDAARAVFTALVRGGLDGRRLMGQVAKAAGSGHLQLWSADPAVETDLRRTRAGGALPTEGPFLEVVTQDVGGSKLGVYQHRTVRYVGRFSGEETDLGDGPVPEEEATVTVTLANAAPPGLPEYVTLRPDDPTAPVGQSRTWLSVYLGAGATLVHATVDGRPVAVESTTELGLSVFSRFVTLDRGASSTLVLDVRQPADRGAALTFRQQPLVRSDSLTVDREGAALLRTYSP